jgi:glutamate-1-semialdehyde 2,1-aminomutase
MSAGIATLKGLTAPGAWQRLEDRTRDLAEGLSAAARSAGIPLQVAHAGSMFGAFFAPRPVRDWDGAKASDTARFSRWFWKMLEQKVYLAPSQFEAGFLSTAHGPAEVETTLKAARAAMSSIA